MYSVLWQVGETQGQILVPGRDDDHAKDIARTVVWAKYFPTESKSKIQTGDCVYVGPAEQCM